MRQFSLTDLRPNDAMISACGNYRYILSREALPETEIRHELPLVFVMLNPSTADAEKSDPTVNRCRGFARDWGYNGLLVVNLYGYRATDPCHLTRVDDPVGPSNNAILKTVFKTHRKVVCAWGNNADWTRAYEVLDLMAAAKTETYCLGVTGHGAPKHPLYLNRKTQMEPFVCARGTV